MRRFDRLRPGRRATSRLSHGWHTDRTRIEGRGRRWTCSTRSLPSIPERPCRIRVPSVAVSLSVPRKRPMLPAASFRLACHRVHSEDRMTQKSSPADSLEHPEANLGRQAARQRPGAGRGGAADGVDARGAAGRHPAGDGPGSPLGGLPGPASRRPPLCAAARLRLPRAAPQELRRAAGGRCWRSPTATSWASCPTSTCRGG